MKCKNYSPIRTFYNSKLCRKGNQIIVYKIHAVTVSICSVLTFMSLHLISVTWGLELIFGSQTVFSIKKWKTARESDMILVALLEIRIDGFIVHPYSMFVLNSEQGKFQSFLFEIVGFRNSLFKNWWVPMNPWNPCQRSHCWLPRTSPITSHQGLIRMCATGV